jgi:hypothetical protein
VLSQRFRKKFLQQLRQAFRRGALHFSGELRSLASPAAFEALCEQAAGIDWVVHIKPPFGGPHRVLKYLARYTHRVAISNHRLRSLENGRVTFDWKDYAHGGRKGVMGLQAVEFIRRFLLHVLPAGLVRIRQFGFLANRVRQHKLELCRALLSIAQPTPTGDVITIDVQPDISEWRTCPVCKLGRLLLVELLSPVFQDTS